MNTGPDVTCPKCGMRNCMCGDKCGKCGKGYNACCCGDSNVSWTAILVGALVGVGLSFLFNLFNISIGLAAYNTDSTTGLTAFAVGGFIGIVIGAFVSMFAAGWVAGYLGSSRMAGEHNCKMDLVYGFTTWTIALVLSVMLTAHMGKFVMSHTKVLTHPNASAMMMTNDTGTARADDDAGTAVAVNKDKTDQLATVAFVTFFLFFLGALASCFGAHCALSCCSRRDRHCV